MKKIGIIIVNYNGEEYQKDCIESLEKMEFKDFEICVVDNNSTDNSAKILKEEYPWIQVIECDENYGFAEGNNIGIQYELSRGVEYILLLNNDVVLDSKLLDELLKKSDESTIVVPLIYYFKPENLIWYAGGEMSWKEATGWHYGIKCVDNYKYKNPTVVTYAPACCMLIPSNVFQKIGLMDEKIFMYFDDTDYCVRLQDAGYKIVYNPDAVLWHKVSSSTGGEKSKIQVYYTTRNHFYFIKKYRERISRFSILTIGIKYIVKFILSPIRCKNDKYILFGFLDYRKGKFGKSELF